MSARRQVWESLARLLARVESGLSTSEGAVVDKENPLAKEIHKLGKAQYKANLLSETQVQKTEQALDALRSSQDGDAKPLEFLLKEREEATRRELLEAILPALDSVENAVTSGKKYLAIRDKLAASPGVDAASSEVAMSSSATAVLVSPADRAMLAGWLEGLRLVSGRLLGILEAGGVTPIPSVGHPFDPYLHVAVKRISQTEKVTKSGTIIAEERRGYRSESGVLRYAEVVVYRP